MFELKGVSQDKIQVNKVDFECDKTLQNSGPFAGKKSPREALCRKIKIDDFLSSLISDTEF